MKILFIGDIVAKPGRESVVNSLPHVIKEIKPDLVVANVENIAHGRGVTKETLNELLECGVDFFTSGDHIFWQKDILENFNRFPLIRPANYPAPNTPGVGFKIITPKSLDKKILIINVMGRTSFGGPQSYLLDPFTLTKSIVESHHGKVDYTIVDFHAEATSEKYAFAFYLDGKVDAIVGTHTHVPTCDNRVMPNGTLYVTDIGMTGNIDSVLGVKHEIIEQLFLTAQNQKFEWENTGKTVFRSVILDLDNKLIKRYDLNE